MSAEEAKNVINIIARIEAAASGSEEKFKALRELKNTPLVKLKPSDSSHWKGLLNREPEITKVVWIEVRSKNGTYGYYKKINEKDDPSWRYNNQGAN